MSRMWHAGAEYMRTAPLRVRIMIGLCLVLALVVAGNAAVSNWRGYSVRLDEVIDMKSLEYQRLSRNVAEGQAYEQLHAEMSRLREEWVEQRLVKAGTPSLSEAMLQHIVNDWAERSAVNILSMRVLPRVEGDDFTRMRLSINARAEIGGIQNFLGLVRQSQRLVFFEEVEIKNISANERRYYYFNAQLAAWTVVEG